MDPVNELITIDAYSDFTEYCFGNTNHTAQQTPVAILLTWFNFVPSMDK